MEREASAERSDHPRDTRFGVGVRRLGGFLRQLAVEEDVAAHSEHAIFRPVTVAKRRARRQTDGRPAIRLPARAALGDCHRPKYRVFKMGGDILFDCELAEEAPEPSNADPEPRVTRII